MKMYAQALSLCLAATLAVACGTATTTKTSSDAATVTDSGGANDGATTADGATDDATATDANDPTDAGATDAGATDAGATDAGATDAGATDAGATTDGGSATDAGPAPSLTTCPALADCVMEACVASKFAAGCETKCLGDASVAALTPGAPLLACTKDSCVPACKDSKDPDCINSCITEKCPADFAKCLIGPTNGTDTCGSMFGCSDVCSAKATGQFTCLAGCFDKMSAGAKKDFLSVVTCSNKGDDAACQKLSMKCLTGGKTGAKTCAEGIPCARKCSDLKTDGAQLSCVGKCGEEIKAADTALFVGAASCGANFEADCGATLATCMAPTGTDSCAALAKCADACKAGDDACIAGCIAKGSVASASQLIEFAFGCEAGLPTCGANFLTCMAPDGTASCATSVQCVSSCPTGPTQGSCIQACVLKVKASSADLLKPAITCGAKKDTQSPACKSAIGKCIADQ